MVYVNQYFEKNLSTSEVTTHYYLGGKEVAYKKGAALEYLHTDHLGSTSVTTNTSGAQVSKVAYFPFGGTRSQTGILDTDKRFTGQRLDQTGLYYYGARYYDATIGRFISPDTIVPNPANPQSLNRYSYCLNNPLKYVDPSGHGETHGASDIPQEVLTYVQGLDLDLYAAAAAVCGIMGWLPQEYRNQLLCNDTLHDSVVGYYEWAVENPGAPIPVQYVTGSVKTLTLFGWKRSMMFISDRFSGEAVIMSDALDLLDIGSGRLGTVWFPGALSVNDLKGGMQGWSIDVEFNIGPYAGGGPISEHGAQGAEWGIPGGPLPLMPSVTLGSTASVYRRCCPGVPGISAGEWSLTSTNDWGLFWKHGARWVGFDAFTVDECESMLDCGR